MYLVLAMSKLSSAPSSDRSSVAFSLARRSARSRATSTRCSQSTAFGPYVRIAMTATSPVRHRAAEVRQDDRGGVAARGARDRAAWVRGRAGLVQPGDRHPVAGPAGHRAQVTGLGWACVAAVARPVPVVRVHPL